MKHVLSLGILLLLFIVACTPQETLETTVKNLHPLQLPQEGGKDDLLVEISELPVQTLDDGTKFLIHPNKLSAGGPPKDGIPSIDNPQYDIISDANEWLEDEDTLLFLNYNGVRKAYPTSIMVWHEIVNDYAAGIPIAVTYCPLCITGIAYERIVDNQEVEFGTSGKLFNSNLVMYDRLTESYWTQVDGVAIQGERSGDVLRQVPLDLIKWKDLKETYPDALVLTKETGFNRQYGRDPYLSYYTDDAVWFPVEFKNFSINTKEVVYGLEVNGEFKAYKETDIEDGAIEDVLGGVPIRIERTSGVVNTTNLETGEELIEERHFWFSWYAFHPDTKLYGEE